MFCHNGLLKTIKTVNYVDNASYQSQNYYQKLPKMVVNFSYFRDNSSLLSTGYFVVRYNL